MRNNDRAMWGRLLTCGGLSTRLSGASAGVASGRPGAPRRRASLAGPINNRPQVNNLPHIIPARGAKVWIVLAAGLLSLAGCRQEMYDQPKFIPLRPTDFFGDGRSERPLPEGTVARGHLNDDVAFYTGKAPDGKPVDEFPFPVTGDVLERGRDRFNVYCSPCHDRQGEGNGTIVKRGLRHPPSYHIDRLRQVPNGYLFDVITSGFGAMQDYAAQIPPRDRWAIVAYVRALQLSHHATMGDVPQAFRAQLESGGAQ